MEGSIIHYNDGALIKRRQKLVGKPEFKKTAVHRPAILKWCKDLIPHFGGNNTTTFIFPATDLPGYLLTTRCISIFPIQIRVYATFIHIGDLFCGYILDLFLVRCYFFRILFLIASCLFFRVIPHRFKASRMPLSLHPNVSAISDWYASGCSAT